MAEANLRDTRVFSYICCLLAFLVVFVFQLFGYVNNDWIHLESEDGETMYQRGFNADCVKNSTGPKCVKWSELASQRFQKPFNNIEQPGFGWQVMYFIAILNLLFPIIFAILSFSGCCFANIEKMLKEYQYYRLVFGAAVLAGLTYFLLTIFIFAQSFMEFSSPTPKGYSYGIGFAFVQTCVIGSTMFAAGCLLFFYPVLAKYIARRRENHQAIPMNDQRI